MHLYRLATAALACAAVLVAPATAAAEPSASIRLTGYPGSAERVFTSDDASLFGTVGSFGSPFGPPQPDIFVSAFRGSPFTRLEVTLVPPLGAPLQPGTYSGAGGFGAFPGNPVIHLLYFGPDGSFTCDGGSFTIHSLDPNPFQTLMDVSWAQTCHGSAASGRAVFGIPPDVAPPTITISDARVFVLADRPEGALVTYPLSVSDAVDPTPTVVCSPPDGSTFPAGTLDSPVTCTATDDAGNSSSVSFTVTVVSGEAQLQFVRESLEAEASPHANVLAARAARAAEARESERTAVACHHLSKLEQELAARNDAVADPSGLLASVTRIRGAFGCSTGS